MLQSGQGGAGIDSLEQGGIHEAAGEESQGEPEGEFAFGGEQALADADGETCRDAAFLNGHEAAGRQEADHEDAGDDHGGAGEDARAGCQARETPQHPDAAAHRSGKRAQEGVG
ncbi:MAG: hypothetical protein NTW28_15860 [Candidatus Solibacter sp.]|nr:hypothetical protein [Candidatus Solibacter sp.]